MYYFFFHDGKCITETLRTIKVSKVSHNVNIGGDGGNKVKGDEVIR
jgi:hypothetical protein